MSVAVCRAALLEPVLPVAIQTEEKEEEKQSFEIWNSIQTNRNNMNSATPSTYIHPLVRRYSILMSQKSLETCTENLGSETGSDEFSSGDELDSFSSETESEEQETEEEAGEFDHTETEKRDLFNVNYHCSIARRSPQRSFPPPLPSISRRNGPCLKMQPLRRDGRLVVKAIPVPSVNYLHAERHGGRLLLSFVDTSPRPNSPVFEKSQQNKQEDEETVTETEEDEEEIMEEEEEEEEEVEVVDRGTTVEVKVSTQASVKVHRSSLVINKFVVGSREAEYRSSPAPPEEAEFSGKKTCFAATTAAAAAVAASSMSSLTSTTEGFQFNYLHDRHISRWGPQSPAAAAEAKLLFASKRRRSREELLHDMRRCSELRRPLFIFEQPHCIATS